MTELTVFKETHCATAPELIEALRTTRPRATLFRGHSDARYELVPSLFRKDGWEKLRRLTCPDAATPTDRATATAARPTEPHWQSLLIYHYMLTARFFRISNRNNLLDLDMSDEAFEELDGRTHRTFANEPSSATRAPVEFPEKRRLSFYSLMQHQGLPTPLLDWTEKFPTACFFAADKPDHDLGNRIAVFALNRQLMDLAEMRRSQIGAGALYRPRLYFPRYRGNANLYAQSGAMSYVVNPGDMLDNSPPKRIFDFRIAIESLRNHFDFNSGREFVDDLASACFPVLQKFTLPREEVPDLRRHLRDFGVTPSTIYPGFDGVRREIEGPWPAD